MVVEWWWSGGGLVVEWWLIAPMAYAADRSQVLAAPFALIWQVLAQIEALELALLDESESDADADGEGASDHNGRRILSLH